MPSLRPNADDGIAMSRSGYVRKFAALDVDGLTTSTRYNFTSESGAVKLVNTAGSTWFALMQAFLWDTHDSPYDTASNMNLTFISADQSGTTSDPRLQLNGSTDIFADADDGDAQWTHPSPTIDANFFPERKSGTNRSFEGDTGISFSLRFDGRSGNVITRMAWLKFDTSGETAEPTSAVFSAELTTTQTLSPTQAEYTTVYCLTYWSYGMNDSPPSATDPSNSYWFPRPLEGYAFASESPEQEYDLYTKIDEASPASDTDYIRSPWWPHGDNEHIVALSGATVDTASAVTVRYRYRKEGTATMNLTVTLYEGDSPRTVIATNTHSGIGTSVTAGSFTLSGSEKDAVTSWSNLFLGFSFDMAGQSRFW